MSMTGPEDDSVTVEVPPPSRELSIIRRWAGVAAILLLIAGMFAVAYLRAAAAADTARQSAQQSRDALHSANVAAAKAKAASDRAQATAKCVNAVLAVRNQTATNDATANLAFVRAVTGLFALHPDTPPAVTRKVVAEFKATSLATYRTLAADDLIRKRHPLGRC